MAPSSFYSTHSAALPQTEMVKLMPDTKPKAAAATAKSTALPDQATLQSDATAALDQAKTVASSVVDEAKTQGSQILEQAKGQLADVANKTRGAAEDQKKVVAEQVDGVAQAIDKVAGELESSNAPASDYARMIADNAQALSATIRDKSVDELLGMAQDFGRRQPAAFVGAAALLGFVASRFVMASAHRNVPAAPPASVPPTQTPSGGTDAYR